ncbi:hypothetical protein ACI797_16575 [Geodermatophilus sp. SYSU D00691]
MPAGIAADCSADVTAELRAFLDGVPDHSTIVFTPRGCYRVDGTLELVGREGLVIDGRNATFRTTTRADDTRSHWRFVGGTDLTVTRMRIVGANSGGGTVDAFVPELQHQMGIDLRGPSGVRVEDVLISQVYGDCVYVGAGEHGGIWTRDVEVQDITCIAPGRNGVSVTAGEDVTVTGSTILQPGLWGVDVEPNGGATGAVDITITDDVFTPGVHYRPFFQAVGASGGGRVSGIRVEGNTVQGGTLATRFVPAPGQRWSDVTFSGNRSDTAGFFLPGSGSGAAAVVTVVDVDGVTVAGNHQPGSGRSQVFLHATGSCDVRYSDNSFPGGGPPAEVSPHPCGG